MVVEEARGLQDYEGDEGVVFGDLIFAIPVLRVVCPGQVLTAS